MEVILNINADNITAGAITGPNINMDLTRGRVLFQAGRLYNEDETFDDFYIGVEFTID